MPSRSIRTSEAEDTFTSCQLGLDHPSSKLSMSMCLLPHDWLENILISNGSRKPRCRAIADADEPFGRTINEFVTLTHRSTRAVAGDGPTTSRTRRFGGCGVPLVEQPRSGSKLRTGFGLNCAHISHCFRACVPLRHI